MKLTVSQVRNYLNRLGVGIDDGETVDLRTALPLNVAGRYDAARAVIAGEKCIILFPRSEDMSPGDIALHNAAVRNYLSTRPVFAFSRLDREFAASLKAAKVAYVIPSRQVFLPPRAILESDRAYADDEKPLGAHFTPWAQTALAEYSDIVDNEFLTFALPVSAAKKIPETKIHRYNGDIMESWRYDPRLLNDGKSIVNPLSLYISLKGASDPRIQIATERLLEKTLW